MSFFFTYLCFQFRFQEINPRNYLVLQRNIIPAQKQPQKKKQQATRMTKWRCKKKKLRGPGRRLGIRGTAMTRPREHTSILMAKNIISLPSFSEQFKFTSESASSLRSHEAARLTRKVHRWTTRRSGHIRADSKTRRTATTEGREPLPWTGEGGAAPGPLT